MLVISKSWQRLLSDADTGHTPRSPHTSRKANSGHFGVWRLGTNHVCRIWGIDSTCTWRTVWENPAMSMGRPGASAGGTHPL